MARGNDTRYDSRRSGARPFGSWTDWKSLSGNVHLNGMEVTSLSVDKYDRNYPRESMTLRTHDDRFLARAESEADGVEEAGPFRTRYRAEVAADALHKRQNG